MLISTPHNRNVRACARLTARVQELQSLLKGTQEDVHSLTAAHETALTHAKDDARKVRVMFFGAATRSMGAGGVSVGVTLS